MALYMKQDFSPPVLSRKWIALKFRPNMLIHIRKNIIAILESGLLFREDSIEVEQEAPSPEVVWGSSGGACGGWLTRGELWISGAAVLAALCLLPPRSFNRTTLIYLSSYVSIPLAVRTTHRCMSGSALSALLGYMRDYLALARRAAACLKEFAALLTQIGSLSSVIESTRTLLCRQQSELSVTMSRATSALLGNAPWLREDIAWHAVPTQDSSNLMKIHHAFLVVQSTLLKNIAMVHIPTASTQKIYKNYNERLYWLHNTLISHLLEEFKTNFEALERMYRLLKNAGNKDDTENKRLGTAAKNNWVYSEVHAGIARVCLELKVALNKSNSLDMFLDSCALNNHDIECEILNKDVDDLIDDITKCLNTVQSSQIRLKKLRGKIVDSEPKEDVVVENAPILQIEDREPETKDEVFYFVKTEDDELPVRMSDDVTAPGKKERENTKIVLNELKRKLGKREDMMRERERQALVKTMPELKNIPEFPRQIAFDEYIVKKGYIHKIKHKDDKKRLFRHFKIKSAPKQKSKNTKYNIKIGKYIEENDIKGEKYEAKAFFNVKSKLLTISSHNNKIYVTRWCKEKPQIINHLNLDLDSGSSFSDSIDEAINKSITQAINNNEMTFKVTKKDLEITETSSDSEYYNKRALLQDIRKHRVVRKKNHPVRKRKPQIETRDNVDESLRPIEYSFGAGLAMASVLQGTNAKFLNMAQEEVFNGDGEISNDSGNDEDA